MPDVVQVRNLEKRFHGKPALRNLSFCIPSGRITGLVGPDGAGKTTLLRLLAGLMDADSGEILVNDEDIHSPAEKRKGFIGYMPQKFGLYEDLTVLENLRLYSDLLGVDRSKEKMLFDEMLTFTGLGTFTGRLAGNLSGGMKQKLGLACALLGHPRLLLLDEPGVGVDPISRRELWRMVRSLMGAGMTVLWSTSYLDEAENCDKVLLLDEGKILFDGFPSELTGRLTGRVWLLKNFEGSRRSVLQQVLRENGIVDGVIQGRGIRIVASKETGRETIASIAAKHSGTAESVRPRFEDAFIDVSGGGPGGDSALAERMPALNADGAIVVEAEGLTKKYGTFTAAENITFQIRRGEIFGLLGPNGAGKSTTFKMMCGLLRPTSGTGRIAGEDLRKSASAARRHLGYMAQKFSMYDGLSLYQNMKFFSGIYGLRGREQKEKIERMTEVFNFKDHLSENARDLSLGYKQRLALACAMMHDPVVLFLDEPTSGVAPVTRREFWTHINNIVEKGVTVMVTTHFMDEAEYCDRIALIYRGRAIAIGTPDELKAMVANPHLPEPTMEDAFIELVKNYEQERLQ